MKALNFTISSKAIFIVSILVLTIATSGLLLPQVIAEHGLDGITIPVVAGPNTVGFRDITNNNLQTSTLTSNFSTINDGFFTITVEEEDANLDPTAVDVTQDATAKSDTSDPLEASTTMTETGADTGIFTGTIQVSEQDPTAGNVLQISNGDEITVSYITESLSVVRSSAQLNVINPGNVIVSDVLLDFVGLGFNANFLPVTHAVKIKPIDGATFDISAANAPVITISYANADLLGEDPDDLSMYYRGRNQDPASPFFGVGTGFQEIYDPALADPGLHNPVAMTITSDIANTAWGQLPCSCPSVTNQIFGPVFFGIAPITEGEFMLAFKTGSIGGGGGGGLVSPGLVVNIIAGTIALGGAGGGGSGPPGPTITLSAVALSDSAVETISMPQEIRDAVINHDPYIPLEPITDTYEDFDLPLSINGQGFALGGYENTLVTQTIETGEPTEFVIVYYTNSELAHSSLNFNLGPTRSISGSNVQVLLWADKPPEIIDPYGVITSFTGSINNEDDDLKKTATFSITFDDSILELDEPFGKDVVIRTWTTALSSGDTLVYDAIEFAQPEIVEIADEDIPEPEIQTLKSLHVPIWIKNNAGWWSDEMIEDSDFVAGLEYLIQNEIIIIPYYQIVQNTYSSEHIPAWLKNNAGWWSENLITEEEFIDGIQWLVSNGIIRGVQN